MYLFFILSWDTPAEVYLQLFYFDIQQRRHFIMFFIIHHKTLLISKKLNRFLCDIFNTIICCRQVHLQPTEIVDLRHKENIERQGSIRGRPIIVREIVTLV